MNIGFYFHSIHRIGGAEKMVLWVIEELVARGHDCFLITLDTPEEQPFRPMPAQTKHYRLGRASSIAGKLCRIGTIRRILRSRRADALVGFVMGADKTVHLAAHLAGVPIVAAERNDPVIYRDRLGLVSRAVLWSFFSLVRQILVQLPEYASGYPGTLRHKIAVIPNPIFPRGPASDEVEPEDRNVILNVGRLHHQKGQDLLIEAFARIAKGHPDWTLRIVGSGEERADLEALAERHGILDRVVFAGTVFDPGEELSQAGVFAFPSRYEGFPNALAEAMAAGLPCIGLASCVASRALLGGGAGRLADGEDQVASLAQELDTLIGDPALRRRLGEAARKASSAYDPQTVASQWETALVSLRRRGAV